MVELTGVRKKVFDDRYSLKNEEGEQLEKTPEEMWRRVAEHIAKEEKPSEQKRYADEFYDALEGFKFVPAGRILSGAGAKGDLTFYNCYVIPSPEDSRGGIMKSVSSMMEIMARGGGVGVNISTLRPRGEYVKGVNGSASGAVSFGGLYSFVTGLVIQGGSRRGALMLMLNDSHPDIEEFITVKQTMGKITNANLSVAVSDKLMEAVKADGDWDLEWKGKVYKTMKARELWDLICQSAHASGEPGVVFMERYNKLSNTWYFEDIVCVNPCGEQGLPAWGVCNLGAINVGAFAKMGDKDLDWEGLGKVVHTSLRMLDNVVDSTPYFYKENEDAQLNIRRTGLGTMGLADLLIKLGIRYGSKEAVEFCHKLYAFIRDEAYSASSDIAKEKGAFPDFDKDKYAQGKFIKRLPEAVQKKIYKQGIRNGVILTQAPTGTTALLAGASSGIEPVFDFVFTTKTRLGEHVVKHDLFKQWEEENEGGVHPDYFVKAMELTPDEHVEMQGVIQYYTDSSISKTVNAPEEQTLEEMKDLYMKAYDLGCKGMTYYRDNSRDEAVLYTGDRTGEGKDEEAKKEESGQVAYGSIEPRERPEIMSGSTYKITTGYGKLFVTVNHDEDGNPFEVFATIGKTGGFFAAKSEAICRLVSLALRSGVSVQTVIAQLKGIRGPMPAWSKTGLILSIPDALANVLEQHIKGRQESLELGFDKGADLSLEKGGIPVAEVADVPVAATVSTVEKAAPMVPTSIANSGFAPECPDCQGIMQMVEGCMTCRGCGYSKCG